eukprot:CAMPEP_0115352626 /NCGR_PEP_ID=MMETSP0270-20121206/97607_1 /TAXON_ID=71861 /ORGANISM="Scrippsiella trochoidea, Strain CCMP3099" /LENGTH=102 /DNA_ID=CAMNT_0002774813 /DNA_START=1253 /DNA_END=1561 /DNA_ORIENTATION=-
MPGIPTAFWCETSKHFELYLAHLMETTCPPSTSPGSSTDVPFSSRRGLSTPSSDLTSKRRAPSRSEPAGLILIQPLLWSIPDYRSSWLLAHSNKLHRKRKDA